MRKGGEKKKDSGGDLEVRTERDDGIAVEAIDAAGGDARAVTVVRVLYRRRGARRWTRVCVLPESGQRLEEIEQRAHLVAEAHLREAERRR